MLLQHLCTEGHNETAEICCTAARALIKQKKKRITLKSVLGRTISCHTTLCVSYALTVATYAIPWWELTRTRWLAECHSRTNISMEYRSVNDARCLKGYENKSLVIGSVCACAWTILFSYYNADHRAKTVNLFHVVSAEAVNNFILSKITAGLEECGKT